MNYTGTRFSKSEGVLVELDEAVDRFGPDALRYFLLREVPWDSDGNFSWERFDTRYTSELADGYGNLASRVLAMIVKYRGGVIPDRSESMSLDTLGLEKVRTYVDYMDNHLLHLGAQTTWELVSRANGFIEEQAPWRLAREGADDRLDAVLAALARCVGRISLMASPFLPNKTRQLWERMAPRRPFDEARLEDLERLDLQGAKVSKLSPLFPKQA